MSRDAGLVDVDLVNEVVDSAFAAAKQLDNLAARRVSQRSKTCKCISTHMYINAYYPVNPARNPCQRLIQQHT